MSVHISAVPPLDQLPEHVRGYAQELLDLRARDAEAGQTVAKLTSRLHGAAVAADRADSQVAAEAIRHGKDPAKVGKPNRDKLAADQAAATQHRKAIKAAVEATSTDLCRALIGDDTATYMQTMVGETAEAYRDAITHLVATRDRYLSALAATQFVDQAVACVRGGRSTANYAPATPDQYARGTAGGLRFDTVVEAMTSEATPA